ncbi:MAG: HAD-IIIA family hydrolase [Pseudomonadota bacterium]
MAAAAPKLVVIDRDGTLIRHIPYLCDPAQVELLPGVREGLAKLRAAGCMLFLHTNQSGVGRGYFKLEAALQCNDQMIRLLGMGDALFAAVCVCPEAPDAPIGYRKPSPRFGRELTARYGAAAEDICYIGDNITDLLTAHNLGCKGIGVRTGVHNLERELAAEGLGGAFPVCDGFLAAAECLLAGSPEPAA